MNHHSEGRGRPNGPWTAEFELLTLGCGILRSCRPKTRPRVASLANHNIPAMHDAYSLLKLRSFSRSATCGTAWTEQIQLGTAKSCGSMNVFPAAAESRCKLQGVSRRACDILCPHRKDHQVQRPRGICGHRSTHKSPWQGPRTPALQRCSWPEYVQNGGSQTGRNVCAVRRKSKWPFSRPRT